MDAPTVEFDTERGAYFLAATHGLGVGRIEARRTLEALSEADRLALQDKLLADASLARSMAQQRPVPFDEYVNELVTKGEVAPAEGLEVVYRAGFDVGFTSHLIETNSAVAPTVAPTPGADTALPDRQPVL